MPPASRHNLELDGADPAQVEVSAHGSDGLSVTIGDHSLRVRVLQSRVRPVVLVGTRVVALSVLGSAVRGLTFARSGRVHAVESSLPGSTSRRARPAGNGIITAPMPGRVVRVHVQPGDEVTSSAPLIVIEAMKMQNAIFCPSDGKVERVLVAEGATIERGAVLIELTLISASRP